MQRPAGQARERDEKSIRAWKPTRSNRVLKVLRATIGKKLLISWDPLQAHRSILVRQRAEAQREAIALEFLPAYAPEMNPFECVWGYLKHHAVPNYCARGLGDLAVHARRHLRSMQHRPTLARAFWQQAELF